MSDKKFNGIPQSELEDWANSVQEENDSDSEPITDEQIAELEEQLNEAKEQLKLLQAKCDFIQYLLDQAKKLRDQES